MCNVTFQTFILLMKTIVTKAKIYKNQNVDISRRGDGHCVLCIIECHLFYPYNLLQIENFFLLLLAQRTAQFLHPYGNKQLTGESWIAASQGCMFSLNYYNMGGFTLETVTFPIILIPNPNSKPFSQYANIFLI